MRVVYRIHRNTPYGWDGHATPTLGARLYRVNASYVRYCRLRLESHGTRPARGASHPIASRTRCIGTFASNELTRTIPALRSESVRPLPGFSSIQCIDASHRNAAQSCMALPGRIGALSCRCISSSPDLHTTRGAMMYLTLTIGISSGVLRFAVRFGSYSNRSTFARYVVFVAFEVDQPDNAACVHHHDDVWLSGPHCCAHRILLFAVTTGV